MSITAKQYLVKQIGHELGDTLSANDLRLVQERLNDILSMYEVEDLEGVQIDGEAGHHHEICIHRQIQCKERLP